MRVLVLTYLMRDSEMITLGNHGSGDPTGSPDEGLYDPTPKSTALLPEGHNLLYFPSNLFQGNDLHGYAWVGPRLPESSHAGGSSQEGTFELGSGAVAPRPFARLRSFLTTRFLHFVGLPTAFQEPNYTYSLATLRWVLSYLVDRWFSPRAMLRPSCDIPRTSTFRSNESRSHNPGRRNHHEG